jgi:hypothetical protein
MKTLREHGPESKAASSKPEQSRSAGVDSAGQEVMGPGGANPGLPKPPARAAKRKSGHAAKRRGRLDREVLAKLGKGLKDCFADVQKQEVPERFKALLQQF